MLPLLSHPISHPHPMPTTSKPLLVPPLPTCNRASVSRRCHPRPPLYWATWLCPRHCASGESIRGSRTALRVPRTVAYALPRSWAGRFCAYESMPRFHKRNVRQSPDLLLLAWEHFKDKARKKQRKYLRACTLGHFKKRAEL